MEGCCSLFASSPKPILNWYCVSVCCVHQDGWGSYSRCLPSSCSRTASSTGSIVAFIIVWSTQRYTSRIMRGKCRRHMPVTHFIPLMDSCRVYRITSMCSCSHCTRCCTWLCTWPSTSGRCRSTMATSRCRRCCSRWLMVQHTTQIIICTTRATTASTSLCGIVSVARSGIQVHSKAVVHFIRLIN